MNVKFLSPIQLGPPLEVLSALLTLDVVKHLLVDVVDVLLQGRPTREPLPAVLAMLVKTILRILFFPRRAALSRQLFQSGPTMDLIVSAKERGVFQAYYVYEKKRCI